jgi:hypothetical protein
MICIFCLNDRPGTVEHVFQKAIGGSLTIDRVCEKCTGPLGTHVDAPLVDHPFVVEPRSRLGIPGRDGRVPDPVAELLSGRLPFTDDPDQYAIHCPDPETGKLRPKLLPSEKLVTLPDGRKAKRVVIDELDLAEIPKIVQRVRRRAGLPALSTDELAVEVQRNFGKRARDGRKSADPDHTEV